MFAAKALEELGYTEVVSLSGGFGAWKGRGVRFVVPTSFTQEQRRRYSRHFLLPEVGEAGQRKLLDAKRAAGRRGRARVAGRRSTWPPPASARSGSSTTTWSTTATCSARCSTPPSGSARPKVESARQTIDGAQPGRAQSSRTRRGSTKENVLEIFADYDIIVDGTDNFASRYLINDACVLLGKPNVHGSIFRFEGQATIFSLGDGPCYRCLFADPPPPDLAPNCAEAGVLGVLPGMIGVLQATETIKLILGLGESLSGRLLMYDALDMEFREVRLRRDPECPMCGPDAPTTLDDIDYTDTGCVIPAFAGAH